MIDAIIGDIAGSRFERHSHKSKDFEMFHSRCHPTDDTVDKAGNIAPAKKIFYVALKLCLRVTFCSLD